jgi:hypothetical protein
MSFLDKLKEGLDRAAEEVNEFAQVSKIRLEIGRLQERLSGRFAELGRQLYQKHAAGEPPPDFSPQFEEIARLEEGIRHKQAEVDRIQRDQPAPEGETAAQDSPAAETRAETPPAPPDPPAPPSPGEPQRGGSTTTPA